MPASRGYIARAGRNDWRTPPNVLHAVREAFGGVIDLDPCAPLDPAHWIATRNIALPEDGLTTSWTGSVFVNPPFDQNQMWLDACATEAALGANVIALIPARTDTRYWHDNIATKAAGICFWRGRMRFVGAAASAPFPSALIYWGCVAGVDRFYNAFNTRGHVWVSYAQCR